MPVTLSTLFKFAVYITSNIVRFIKQIYQNFHSL